MTRTPPDLPAVDHVAFAWEDLDEITSVLADCGLEPTYGGRHADGTTHMSILGFADGSYLELIAATDADRRPVRWPEFVTSDAGPAGWAVVVEDVAAELKRLIDRGAEVSGPREGGRERPDGTLVEWDEGVYGSEETVQMLPFVIADLTPRHYRIEPTPGVADGPLTGVEHVVLAVPDADDAADAFRRHHRYPSPRRVDASGFGAEVSVFPGRPAMLAEPDGESWVADRLDRFRPAPCAFLLGTDDFGAAADRYPLTEPTEWGDRRVAWFDADPLRRRLGVIERE